MLRSFTSFIVLLLVITGFSGCTSNNQSSSNSTDYSRRNEVALSLEIQIGDLEGVESFTVDNDKATSYTIYVTSALFGGSSTEKKTFAESIADLVHVNMSLIIIKNEPDVSEPSKSSIIIYFKAKSDNSTKYAMENGVFVDYE